MCQCMEHRNMGYVPAARELLGNRAGEPVVAVQEIVGLVFAARKGFKLARINGYILGKVVLRDGRGWSRFDGNDAHIGAEVGDFWLFRMRATRKDIDSKIRAGQVAAQVTNI